MHASANSANKVPKMEVYRDIRGMIPLPSPPPPWEILKNWVREGRKHITLLSFKQDIFDMVSLVIVSCDVLYSN